MTRFALLDCRNRLVAERLLLLALSGHAGSCGADVRYWPKADMSLCAAYVRFWG